MAEYVMAEYVKLYLMSHQTQSLHGRQSHAVNHRQSTKN